MKVSIRKGEDGVLVRIPSEMAEKLDLTDGDEVELRLRDDAVEIFRPGARLRLGELLEGMPGRAPAYTVAELMEGFTEDQRHPEWDTGPSVGAEAW